MQCIRIVAIAVAILVAGSASAQPERKEQARVLAEKAQAFEQEGAFEAAADNYRQAYWLIPHPTLLFNLGQAYRRGGDPVRAYHFFKTYLLIRPDGDLAELARKLIEELGKAMTDKQKETPPPDDDILNAKTPTTAETASSDPVASETATVTVMQPMEERSRHMTPLTWGLAGGGLVGLGIGSYLVLTGHSNFKDCDQAGGCETQSEADGIRRRMIAGDIVIGVSVASLVAAGTLYWLSEGSIESPVSVSSDGTGAAVWWSGRF